MVEPFSIIEVILGVVERCIVIYELIDDAHRASQGMVWLAKDLKTFSENLLQIENDVRKYLTPEYNETKSAIKKILENAKADLVIIENYLDKNWAQGGIMNLVKGTSKLKDLGMYQGKIVMHITHLNNAISKYGSPRRKLTDGTRLRHLKYETATEKITNDIRSINEGVQRLLAGSTAGKTEDARNSATEPPQELESTLAYCVSSLDEVYHLESDSVSIMAAKETSTSLLKYHLESAVEKTLEGEFAEARDYLERILETGLNDNDARVREKALEILAAVCAFEAKWDEAEQTLARLRSAAPIGNHYPKAMHMVARAHLNSKSYTKAFKWCKQARYWWKENLGDQSLFYYLSTNLLAEIFEARGDILDAKSLRRNLPPKFEGKLLLLTETYKRMSSR